MSKRLLLLNLMLVSAAVVFSVQLVRVFVASPHLPVAPPVAAPRATRVPTAEPARPRPSLAAYDVVAARNLFNPTRSETATATAAVPTVKPLLYGIVLSDGTSSAFLEDPVTKKVFGYRPGDQVAGGQLERIEADRVVIRRGEGTFEVLLRDPSKPKPVAAAPPPAAPGAQPTPAGSPQVQAPPTPTPTAPRPPATLFRRPQSPATPTQ